MSGIRTLGKETAGDQLMIYTRQLLSSPVLMPVIPSHALIQKSWDIFLSCAYFISIPLTKINIPEHDKGHSKIVQGVKGK